MPEVTALFPSTLVSFFQLVDGGTAMFYPWLVDEVEALRAPEEETVGPWARFTSLPSCNSAIDAIWLFNKRSRLRPIRRFADF